MNREEQNQAFYWSLITLDLITFIVNLTTSLLFIKFRRRLLVSTHNRILFSMALADTLVGVFGFNLGLLLYLKQPSKYYKLAGNIPMFSSLFGSVLALALLTSDRLVAVKKPFIYKSNWYRMIITKLLVVSWGIPAAVTIIQSLLYIHLSPMEELHVRSYLFSIFFLLAVVILVFFNIFLILKIRTQFANIDSKIIPTSRAGTVHTAYEPDQGDLESSGGSNKKVRDVVVPSCRSFSIATNADQTTESDRNIKRGSRRIELRHTSFFCAVIVSLFIVFWAPLAVYRLYFAVGISLKIAWLRRLALCLTVVNSLLNPVFYFLVKKELRKYLAKFFHLG